MSEYEQQAVEKLRRQIEGSTPPTEQPAQPPDLVTRATEPAPPPPEEES
jgi:hypothetical protein